MIFDFFYFLGSLKTKTKKRLNGNVWYVIRCALKRQFQKYITLINRCIRSRVMAETPKLKKNEVLVFDHKSVNFQYIYNILYSFIPYLYMSYNSLAQKVLPRHNSVRFCFFAQKGVFNCQNKKKTADQINSIVLRIP